MWVDGDAKYRIRQCEQEEPAAMKSPSGIVDDCDDIFGPPRTYATGYCPPKNRPSMISAKYRQKEERRKVLKISINKLKKIEDPEASLCRSVLINNTMKRLQKEARDEKIQKQQLNYPRCYDNDNFLNIKSEFMKNEMKGGPAFDDHFSSESESSKIMDSLNAAFAIEGDISALHSDNSKDEVLNGLFDNNIGSLDLSANNNSANVETSECERFPPRKRSFDDMEDCDVQNVLSQFYMPPTPKMLTCIDDDEDVNVVDDEPLPKRPKVENAIPPPAVDALPHIAHYDTKLDTSFCQAFDSSRSSEQSEPASKERRQDDFSRVSGFSSGNITEADSRLRYLTGGQSMDTDTNSYSCGHASMFNELQSNVFHSLIASLET